MHRSVSSRSIVVGRIAPLLGVYPTFPHEVAGACIVRMRFQSAARLHGISVVRSCRVFRRRGVCCGYSIKEWGVPPESAFSAGMLSAALLGWVFGSLAIAAPASTSR